MLSTALAVAQGLLVVGLSVAVTSNGLALASFFAPAACGELNPTTVEMMQLPVELVLGIGLLLERL